MRQASGMVRLNALQREWLQELGVEAALLRPYSALPPQARIRPQAELQTTAQKPSANVGVRSARPMTRALIQDASSARRTPSRPATRPAASAMVQVQSRSQQSAFALACQVYAALPGAAQQRPWLIVSEAVAGVSDTRTLVQGRAGQLLCAMLAAVGMQAGDSVLRFQAPAALDGAASLQDQMKDQVGTLQPACILALGRVAAAALLQTTADLASLRGKVWSYADEAGAQTPVIVTYPPGWLLANPQHKADVWRDLLLARAAQTVRF